MQAASVPLPANRNPVLVRERAQHLAHQWAHRLLVAAIDGDDELLQRLLSSLLRTRTVPRARLAGFQVKTLLKLVSTLRHSTHLDPVTGLQTRRGFVQAATRVLDVAARDGSAAFLVRFAIERPRGGAWPVESDVLMRQTGNFLRDLFPDYGVYEVLARLGGGEFAALTTTEEHASRCVTRLQSLHLEKARGGLAANLVRILIARFNPQRPVAIDELLEDATTPPHAEHRSVRNANSAVSQPQCVA